MSLGMWRIVACGQHNQMAMVSTEDVLRLRSHVGRLAPFCIYAYLSWSWPWTRTLRQNTVPWRSCLPGRQLQSMQDCNNRHPSYDRWHWHVQCHVYGKSDGDQHCLCIWAGLYVDFLESGRRSPSDTNLPSISLAVGDPPCKLFRAQRCQRVK